MNDSSFTLRPIVLSIAGFDPSCGAGVGADLKTIAACGAYGIAAITALTIQNTVWVNRVVAVNPADLREQIECLMADITPAAVKIGMLATQANTVVVADVLRRYQLKQIVLDPVMESSSGTPLLESAAIETMKQELFPLATCVTPNIEEAARLTAHTVTRVEEMQKAAQKIKKMGARSVVITGGHLEEAIDVFYDGISLEEFRGSRIESKNTHGTGCAFSSALASFLARGVELPEAVRKAKHFVMEAIRQAYPVGRGHGPIHHFFP